jgi:hypothetical protein
MDTSRRQLLELTLEILLDVSKATSPITCLEARNGVEALIIKVLELTTFEDAFDLGALDVVDPVGEAIEV